jgi:hypothetical protein
LVNDAYILASPRTLPLLLFLLRVGVCLEDRIKLRNLKTHSLPIRPGGFFLFNDRPAHLGLAHSFRNVEEVGSSRMLKSVSEIRTSLLRTAIPAHSGAPSQQSLDDAIPPISVAELMELAHSLFCERPRQRFSAADNQALPESSALNVAVDASLPALDPGARSTRAREGLA